MGDEEGLRTEGRGWDDSDPVDSVLWACGSVETISGKRVKTK